MESTGFVTSIRYDAHLLLNQENEDFAPVSRRPCHLYMLAFHRDRLLAAARAADRNYARWEGDSGLELMVDRVQELASYQGTDDSQALKVRMVVDHAGAMELTSSPVTPITQIALFPKSLDDVLKGPPTYRVFVAPVAIIPDFHTRFKTTERSQYDEVRSFLPEPQAEGLNLEILLVNRNGDIMEGSLTTPYFKHDGDWVTPAESSGGNLGTTRRWALEQGICEECFVNKTSVLVGSPGEKVVLSNGVRGFGWGRVESLPPR